MDLLVAVTEAAVTLTTTEQPAASLDAVAQGAELGEAACLVLRRLGPGVDGIAYLSAAQAFAEIRQAIDDAAVEYGRGQATAVPRLEAGRADVFLAESALAGLASDLSITLGLLARRTQRPEDAEAASRAVESAVRARQILTRRGTHDDLR